MVLRGSRRVGKTTAILGGALLASARGVALFVSPLESIGRHAMGVFRHLTKDSYPKPDVRFYTAGTFEFVRQLVREMRPNLRLIVVDEVQMMRAPRDRKLGRTVVSAFRRLALEHKIPVWLVLGEPESRARGRRRSRKEQFKS